MCLVLIPLIGFAVQPCFRPLTSGSLLLVTHDLFLRNKKSLENRLSCFSETHNSSQPVPYSLRDCDNQAERDIGITPKTIIPANSLCLCASVVHPLFPSFIVSWSRIGVSPPKLQDEPISGLRMVVYPA